MCIKDMIIANSRGQEKGFLTESAPVSYTHLDVYKRQLVYRNYESAGYRRRKPYG